MPIYLPLKKLDKCKYCGKGPNEISESLRLCSACGERIYCSATCQKQDWQDSHKDECGKTDRIDLATFYPFLAVLAGLPHSKINAPMHVAIEHQIVNSPNPGMSATPLPDGTFGKVVELGKKLTAEELRGPLGAGWWPKAPSQYVRSKLFRQIILEGKTLPIVVSVCLAVAAEIYTTTSTLGSSTTRKRLRYRSSPIADFGICKGSVLVHHEDRLVYKIPGEQFLKGQDPYNHYWIYFTTVHGEEIVFDIGMFSFNLCSVVQVEPYIPENGPIPFVPAFFRDRNMAMSTPRIHTERARTSFLWKPNIQRLVSDNKFFNSKAGDDAIIRLMEEIGGSKCDEESWEKPFLLDSLEENCRYIRNVLTTKKWKDFPAKVPLCIIDDPGSYESMDHKKVENEIKMRREINKHIRKISRKKVW